MPVKGCPATELANVSSRRKANEVVLGDASSPRDHRRMGKHRWVQTRIIDRCHFDRYPQRIYVGTGFENNLQNMEVTETLGRKLLDQIMARFNDPCETSH
jgi:hypothetical protein